MAPLVSAPGDRDGRADVWCFATQGAGSGDERRVRELLATLEPTVWPFDRAARLSSGLKLLRDLIRRRPALIVMEGTGVAGGAAVIAARLLAGVRYVVSSGDAVGPYVGLAHPRLALVAGIYERLLYRLSSGFLGWSPYLVGRALTFGAPRAMTAANWSASAQPEERMDRRRELGISEEAIAFGLVGSLDWSSRVSYCYGLELVRAVMASRRADMRVVVIGDGSGLERLRRIAGDEVGRRVILPGSVESAAVPGYLAAMDVASLPQSVDGVGSFRYTTKISEYLAARLPVVTGELPLAFDLDDGWMWRLPGDAPWDTRYVAALTELMDGIDAADLAERRKRVPTDLPLFDGARQRREAAVFIRAILRAQTSA
jgi:hypothetical protein